jgi:hypothetical protein
MRLPRTAVTLALAALLACRENSALLPSEDESLGQRVFEPPRRVVRAVPPHRIQPGGLGEYELGAELKEILNTLPHGPRIELLQIEHLVSYRLVRAAQDTILVGIGQNERVSFVAVLDPEIAKTEGGFGVGSEIDKLRDALGPERAATSARDPRLVELERLPNARFVVEQGKVVAIVVGPDAPPGDAIAQADALSGGGPGSQRIGPAPPDPSETGCTEASAREALSGDPVAAIARVGDEEATDSDRPAEAVHYGCFTGATPEVIVEGKGEVVLVVGEPGRLRRAASVPAPGLLFARAVDTDGDGRHELIAVSEDRAGDALTVRVEVLRGENSRLVGAGADEVYRVTTASAAPVGAKLKDVDLLVEAQAGAESIQVTGFYLHRAGGKVLTIAPLLPKTIVLRPRKRSEAGGASTPPGPAARSSAGPRAGRKDDERR